MRWSRADGPQFAARMMRIMELAREALVSGHLISKRYLKYDPNDKIR